MECDSQPGLRVQMIGAAQNSQPCKEKNAGEYPTIGHKTTFFCPNSTLFNRFSRGRKMKTAQ
jgi:hypothetical protein